MASGLNLTAATAIQKMKNEKKEVRPQKKEEGTNKTVAVKCETIDE